MKKEVTIILAALLVVSSASAISLDTTLDLGCSVMTSFLMGGCLPVLYDDIIQASPSEVHKDIYIKTQFYEDERKRTTTEHSSHINQTHGMAMSEAKLTIIENLNNGSSRAEATEEALKDVDEFYAQQQKALIADKNKMALKFNNTIRQSLRETSGLNLNKITYQGASVGGYDHNPGKFPFNCGMRDYSVADRSIKKPRFHSVNITLLDNETVESHSVSSLYHFDWHEVNDQWGYWRDSCNRRLIHLPLKFDNENRGSYPLYIRAEDANRIGSASSTNFTKTLSYQEYKQVWNKIKSSHSRARENVVKMTDKIYRNYQQGQLEANEVLGPLEQLQLASTNYNSTGYYSYLAVSLEMMGLSSNQSYAFKVKWWNEEVPPKTAVGQLFATKDSFEVPIVTGKNYTTENRNVWFVHQTEEGKATTTQFNGTFRILQMTDKSTGEEINQTSLQSTEFHTESTEDLKNQLEDIKKRQEELLSSQGGGGALSDVTSWLNDAIEKFGISLPELNNSVVAVIGLIALLLLIQI